MIAGPIGRTIANMRRHLPPFLFYDTMIVSRGGQIWQYKSLGWKNNQMKKTNKLQWSTIRSMNMSGVFTPLDISINEAMERLGVFMEDNYGSRQYTNGCVKYFDNGIVITIYETKS